MRRAIVHIGTEKTGSTSIQDYFLKHQEWLSANNIFLANRFCEGTASRHSLLYPQMLRGYSAEQEILRAFRRDVELSDPSSDWIISSEHLHSRLKSKEQVTRLSDYLNSIFDSVELVLYLRQPIKHMISLLSTEIVNGLTPDSLYRADSPKASAQVNHRETLILWVKNFAHDNIRVNLFQPENYHNGNLIHDFFHQIDRSMPTHAISPTIKSNASLSLTGMFILWKLNHEFPLRKNGIRNKERNTLARFVKNHTSDNSKFLPTDKQFSKYEDFFAESDEWVRQTYFPHQKTLWVAKKTQTSSLEIEFSKRSFMHDLSANLLSLYWHEKNKKISLDRQRGGGVS